MKIMMSGTESWQLYREFLQYGRMMKPELILEGGKYTLKLINRTEVFNSFFHSSWLAKDGARGEFITNFLPKSQSVYCRVPKNHQVIIEDSTYTKYFEITLEPLSSIYVKIFKI